MPTNNDRAAEISSAARQLLQSGAIGDDWLRRSATVGQALPVLTPEIEIHSWFVPVTVTDRLAAFFQFLANGTFMRFSSFQRRSGELTGCPAAADWLNHGQIAAHVSPHQRADETPGTPFLTFDRSPDRLVWAVPLTDQHGVQRMLFVVGETVYAPLPGNTIG